jgi:hypothetical protein
VGLIYDIRCRHHEWAELGLVQEASQGEERVEVLGDGRGDGPLMVVVKDVRRMGQKGGRGWWEGWGVWDGMGSVGMGIFPVAMGGGMGSATCRSLAASPLEQLLPCFPWSKFDLKILDVVGGNPWIDS